MPQRQMSLLVQDLSLSQPVLTVALSISKYLTTPLNQPISFEFSPINPNLAYVAEKSGVIELYDLNSGTLVSNVLDITAQVNNVSDRGVMDIALHPDLENNPYLYVFYVVDPAETAGRRQRN